MEKLFGSNRLEKLEKKKMKKKYKLSLTRSNKTIIEALQLKYTRRISYDLKTKCQDFLCYIFHSLHGKKGKKKKNTKRKHNRCIYRLNEKIVPRR